MVDCPVEDLSEFENLDKLKQEVEKLIKDEKLMLQKNQEVREATQKFILLQKQAGLPDDIGEAIAKLQELIQLAKKWKQKIEAENERRKKFISD